MRKIFQRLFAVLPLAAMAAASVTFIKSLFYNFHNDTVPLFSIGFSCSLSLANIGLLVLAALCVFGALGAGKLSAKDKTILLTAALLLNLGFGAVCALVKQTHYAVIAVYLLLTSLCQEMLQFLPRQLCQLRQIMNMLSGETNND